MDSFFPTLTSLATAFFPSPRFKTKAHCLRIVPRNESNVNAARRNFSVADFDKQHFFFVSRERGAVNHFQRDDFGFSESADAGI